MVLIDSFGSACTPGNGSSPDKAVIINAETTKIGVRREYAYVEQVCGQINVDWSFKIQSCRSIGERKYDVLEIEMKDGSFRVFWFDITSFFGK
jgi:hypothetical protein